MKVNDVGATPMPTAFAKGSGEYVEMRQQIDNLVKGEGTNFNITCETNDEIRKAKASAERYFKKRGYELIAKKDNLTLWIAKKV